MKLGKEALCKSAVCEWYKNFKSGFSSVEDQRSGDQMWEWRTKRTVGIGGPLYKSRVRSLRPVSAKTDILHIMCYTISTQMLEYKN